MTACAKGKPFKVALAAVMLANSLVRDDRNWTPGQASLITETR